MSAGATPRIAIVGCGVISGVYATTLAALGYDVAACVDEVDDRAAQLASTCGSTAVPFDAVLADETITAAVNLTPPVAHHDVSQALLASAKHTFSEKPLGVDLDEGRALVALAAARGLRLGCAPDTFLGVGLQTCRQVIDRGDIGEPIGANGFMLGAGPELWHPNPDIFFARGGGPLLDMGPYYVTALVQLLGPVARVTAAARSASTTRTIRSLPRRGEEIPVEVPTHVSTVAEHASGAVSTIVTSFDVQATRYRHIEVYGTEGTLAVPDPNTFGGPVLVRGLRDQWWHEVALLPADRPQARGIGFADMLAAEREGRAHRANGELALHVLEVMTGALASAEQGTRLELTTTCERSEPLGTATDGMVAAS